LQQAAPRSAGDSDYKIAINVNLVVLHATVTDNKGHLVSNLDQSNFRVFEDNVEQKLSVFRHEDIPVTMGLVIDNSGSMREKRERVVAAALTFVKTSNSQDEVFVVNFNDDYYLDLDKDFTSDLGELKDALEKIDSRGSTAFYDAVIGSLEHVRKGNRDKKVLLVITDGADNASRYSFEKTLQFAQQSDAVIYTIGLFGEETSRQRNKARRALLQLAQATGGVAYFPDSVELVESICRQVAHDIRNQYTLAYYPSNIRRDGSFRTVSVVTVPPKGMGKLYVRTRTGYFAQRGQSAGGM
jgi:VWFA-related protein